MKHASSILIFEFFISHSVILSSKVVCERHVESEVAGNNTCTVVGIKNLLFGGLSAFNMYDAKGNVFNELENALVLIKFHVKCLLVEFVCSFALYLLYRVWRAVHCCFVYETQVVGVWCRLVPVPFQAKK